MDTIILKIFLLVSLFLVWTPGILASYIRRKMGAEHEVYFEPDRVKTRSTNLIYASWFVAYILWVFMVGLYWLNLESVSWFWKITALDIDSIKVLAIVITCIGYYLLIAAALFYMIENIKPAIAKGEKTPLVTTGIYRYTRNPMYLAINIGVLCTFLIMPNLLTLIMATGMIAVLHSVSLDEEKRLQEIYGEEYEKYRNDVGMVFPKLKRGY